MAVRQRSDPRRPHSLGARCTDLAIICMALLLLGGSWSYRRLALCNLPVLRKAPGLVRAERIAEAAGPSKDNRRPCRSRAPLCRCGNIVRPWPARCRWRLPSSRPEGRALITLGMLEEMPANGFWFLMLMAAMTTIFIWLYVDAVRKICLEKRGGDEPEDAEPAGWILRRESGLGAFSPHSGLHCRRPFGLFRAPVSDLVGEVFPDRGGPTAARASRFLDLLFLAFCHRLFIPVWLAPHGAWAGHGLRGRGLCLCLRIPRPVPWPISSFPDWPHQWLLSFPFIQSATFIPGARAGTGFPVADLRVPGRHCLHKQCGLDVLAYWELMTFASYFLVVYENNARGPTPPASNTM